jgi:nucleotide-binding universal stress UspA family protein
VLEFARHRGARLVVLGSRRRWIGRSVSRAVIRAADRPVVVAGSSGRLAPAVA